MRSLLPRLLYNIYKVYAHDRITGRVTHRSLARSRMAGGYVRELYRWLHSFTPYAACRQLGMVSWRCGELSDTDQRATCRRTLGDHRSPWRGEPGGSRGYGTRRAASMSS